MQNSAEALPGIDQESDLTEEGSSGFVSEPPSSKPSHMRVRVIEGTNEGSSFAKILVE